jgi:hypothetical protein
MSNRPHLQCRNGAPTNGLPPQPSGRNVVAKADEAPAADGATDISSDLPADFPLLQAEIDLMRIYFADLITTALMEET